MADRERTQAEAAAAPADSKKRGNMDAHAAAAASATATTDATDGTVSKRPKREAASRAALALAASGAGATAAAAEPSPSSARSSATAAAGASPFVYPPPLIHPGDELDLDPECPEQSLSEWVSDENRNEVTKARRVIYLVAPPKAELQRVRQWALPSETGKAGRKKKASSAAPPPSSAPTVQAPAVEDVAAYLRAVFLPLEVKVLPSLTLVPWGDDDEDGAAAASHLGLNIGSELVRIRSRRSVDGAFPRQLNLSDLLDAAISLVAARKDAYALCMLLEHDLYESKDDVFTCGRAFGGDRVAVVSIARYNPALDAEQDIDRGDVWPASHFAPFAPKQLSPAAAAAAAKGKSKKSKELARRAAAVQQHDDLVAHCAPLQAALAAHHSILSSRGNAASADVASLAGLWLGRACKTAAHELGHCFCLEHCVTHACIMQGSANLREDARQPPYLCAHEHAKLTRATGATERAREEAIKAFCEKHPRVALFAAMAAWIRAKQAATGQNGPASNQAAAAAAPGAQ